MRLPFDEYEIRARIYPALITSLPGVSLFYAVVPGARSGFGAGAGTLLECAVLYFLARIARDRGYRIQAHLYEKWGGKPTTTLLRHQNSTIDPLTKHRYKSVLSKLTGISFPNEQTELESPHEADYCYESCVRALLEQRRDVKKYRLIFNEDCTYGFARNLFGIRSFGIALSIAVLAINATVLFFGKPTVALIASIAITLSILLFLIIYVNSDLVKRSGEAYAIALLRSCEPGPQKTSSKPKSPDSF